MEYYQDDKNVETKRFSNKIYSFHSFSWAFISDVGLESEECRCCGDFRFSWYALIGIICLCRRKYFGSLYFLEEDNINEIAEFDKFQSENSTFKKVDGKNIMFN